MSETNASKERLRLWLRLLSVSRLVETELRERMRVEFDITLPRFDVMAALARNSEGLRMSELSSVLRVSNGNVTGIVDRLVDDGYAKREAVPGDRRASRVHLTRAGKQHFEILAKAHETWIDSLLSGFTQEEATQMAHRLVDWRDNLQGEER